MPSVSERGIGIRPAAASDEPFIGQLAALAFGEYDLSASRTTIRMTREPEATTLVATRDARPIGFVILRRDGASGLSLDAIAVSPSERGKRVGQRLIAAAARHAESQAAGRITLCTAQANVAALELFLRAGFVITARMARYYRGDQPACRLEKRFT